MPISKKLNGALLSGVSPKVHSSPIKSAASSKNSILNNISPAVSSIKIPTIANKSSIYSQNEASLVNINSLLTEVDNDSNSSAKIFTLHTGLSESEPTIVLSSEFVPLYESGERTKQGRSISLKEGSKIINAKTAITVLSQSADVKTSIDFNKRELQNYIDEENSFLSELITRTDQTLSSLDISHYALGFYGALNFKNTLTRNGYSSEKIINFSNTKLWQQSLVETKKSLVSHTSEFISQNFVRNSMENDIDPFKMSDIENVPNNLKKLWINPYGIKLPTSTGIKNVSMTSVKDFTDYDLYRFVNLKYANLAEKKIVVTGPKPITDPTLGPIFFSNQILSSFESSGKDISILANMVFKEASLSSFLGKQGNVDTLKTKFGYNISRDSDNFVMWDYVIGQASKTTTDFFKSPAGNGNSLISFSQNIISNGSSNYRILTLENDFLENTNTTPGSYYYVDSCLNTVDGKNFDLTRLESLIGLTNSSRETTRMIIEMLGYEISPTYSNNPIENLLTGLGENYVKRPVSDVFDLTGLIDRLSIVSQTYQKCLEISSDSPQAIRRLQTESMRPDFSFTYEETIGVRLASMLCKTLISPVDSYSSVTKKIKPLMFMWLMNIVVQQTQGSGDSGNGPLLKKQIANQFGSITVSSNEEELGSAFEDVRTFPISIGTAPYIEQRPDLTNSPVDYGTMEDLYAWLASNYNDDKSRTIDYWRANLTGSDPSSAVTGTPDTDINGVYKYREYREQLAQERPDEVSNERRQAYNIYSRSVAGRIFQIDESKGLWRVMIDILKSAFTSAEIYTGDFTNYSRLSKVAYMYNLFDLILRIIAAQTPENLLGVYTSNYQYKTNNIAASNYSEDAITIHETGFLVDRVSADQLNQQYNVNAIIGGSSTASETVNKLSDAITALKQEERSVINDIGLFRKYFLDLGNNLQQYKSFLSNNFQPHLDKLVKLFQQDTSLEDKKKNSLINLAFSQGQIKLSKYYISELSDRISQTGEVASRLKSQPFFANFPEGFIDYMPVNETELVSCAMLSPYFKSNEFYKSKGNNKKIISVGIPPKLIQKLVSSVRLSTSAQEGLKQGLIRIKMYKVDRLHPDIVYQPKIHLFDMNRYPTRVISNWNYEAFASEESNLLSIPTKLVKPNGTVILHKDFTEAFPVSLYSNYLSDEEKKQLYSNHSTSFLSEEYLRWFTDTRFDEVRYNNFSKLSLTLNNVEQQYQTYVNTLTNAPVASSVSQNSVTAQFTDNSGKVINVLISKPANLSTVTTNTKIKPYVIPMNDTIRTFFMNETFLSDTDIYKRRISYPKKFDRVFNMIIDPDDFIVDESMTTKSTLDYLVSHGILLGGTIGDTKIPYRHRDTSPDDITLDEYFVTVEPYDYVQEYEG